MSMNKEQQKVAKYTDVADRQLPFTLYEVSQVISSCGECLEVRVAPIEVDGWGAIPQRNGAIVPLVLFTDQAGSRGAGTVDMFYLTEADATRWRPPQSS